MDKSARIMKRKELFVLAKAMQLLSVDDKDLKARARQAWRR